MNANKHTPGPWSHTPMQDTIWANDGDLKIATIADLPWTQSPTGKPQSDWQTEQANARLIAAAPTLLDACQSALIALETGSDSWRKTALTDLRHAIAQAQAGGAK